MEDSSDTPVKERKSFLRKLFSQAEPAPSKRPKEDPDWRSQAEVVADTLSGAEAAASAADQEQHRAPEEVARAVPTIAAKPDPSPAADVPTVPAHAISPAEPSAPAGADALQPSARASTSLAADTPPRVETAPPPSNVVAMPTVDGALASPASAEPAPETPARVPVEVAAEPKRSWWTRLRDGLSRSSTSIGTGIGDIFTKRRLDSAMLDDLEDVLIRADLGVAAATRICDAVGRGRFNRDVSPDDVKAILSAEVERVLAPYARPIVVTEAKPFVILVVGVNGSGKTTTIGKLAAKLTAEGQKVTLAAGDTFRAAAIAQLRIWGERLGCPVIAREQGSDAASLAYAAIEECRGTGADVLLMDTAGRLQNRAELMAELEKIIRVMRKLDETAPHAVLLVLDATVGQNAISQVEVFGKVAGVTGLVMTKLDGTARGGILVAIAEKFKLPVHFIGVGETAEDLSPFVAGEFAAAIAGLEVADAA